MDDPDLLQPSEQTDCHERKRTYSERGPRQQIEKETAC